MIESLRLIDPDAFRNELKTLKPQASEFDEKNVCYYHYLLGYEKALDGDFLELKTYFSPWLKQCSDQNILARMYAILANVQVISGEFENALNDLDLAIKYADAGDADVKEMTYSAAAIVYEQMEQFELSVKYAQLVQDINPSDSNLCKLNYFRFNEKLIHLYQGRENQEILDAIDHCEQASLLIQSLYLRFKFMGFQANNHLTTNTRIADLHQQLLDLKPKVEKTKYKNIKAFYWAFLAQVLEKMEQLDAASLMADQSLEENEGLGDTEQKIMALDVKVRVSLKKANDQMAYLMLKEKTDSENRRFDVKQAKLAAFMKVKHDNVVKEFEITQLNQKNKVLEMEQVIADKNAVNQRLITILLFVVASFLALWVWRAQKRQKELKKLSELDHLTQVLNRQGLEANVTQQLAVAERENTLVHLAILDLDHFKLVNDEHGHLAGDWVLKHVIALVNGMMDESMLLGRLGGEEFAVWCFDVPVHEVKKKMESIREQIEKLDCSASGYEMNITASFGVAHSINSGYKMGLLLKHADDALYQAKETGRNKVVVYQH